MEEWVNNREYERLGLEEKKYKIINISLPYFIIPVKPGRNIALLIEVAAATQRLKSMGVSERKIIFVAIISAPVGLQKIKNTFPEVKIIVVQEDDGLDEKGFILPGVGDFGDRYYGI